MFEYIHPFYDGNGRTGRYLLALYLSEPLSALTSLSLSREIAENRSPYYKAFQDAEAPMNHGELTPFVIQMLEYVSSAQDRLIADLGEKSQRLGECHDLLGRAGSDLALTERESELLYLLVQHDLFAAFPAIQLDEATAYMRMGRQSTRKYLGSLVEKGLVYLPESAFENDVSDFLAHAMYTATLATQASDTMAHMAEYPTPVMSAPATPPPRP